MIQLYFIIKSSINSSGPSTIVYVSTIWSVLMISNKAFREDKLAFKPQYQRLSISKQVLGYFGRACYRMTDVLYRLSVLLLFWVFLSGWWCGVILGIEGCIIFYLCRKNKEFSLFYYCVSCFSNIKQSNY